jgi:cystathionine beta-synthase
LPRRTLVTAYITDKLSDVLVKLKQHGISQLPVLDGGKLAGILTETDVLSALVSGRVDPETSVAEVMVRTVSTVAKHASSQELPRIFERGEVALVVDDDRRVEAILTKMDLIELLAARKNASFPGRGI